MLTYGVPLDISTAVQIRLSILRLLLLALFQAAWYNARLTEEERVRLEMKQQVKKRMKAIV